ncbi:rRNA-processing protein EFG1 [Spathaspora passalidarum NRRL Y-27907]|uniref:rRNA-processing protein EFG1 n=1 Tax=Spathaspora passalidarum (strain NRRL Y-27907 / 11-Y1) TaxID=619300 RepID=G3ASI9_SPAPN|nr:rRNA-processing protein EFG1 [Spathaspora passalidarum NRRL Y-27907]EGW31107.1 rRNA-processing protein EFG1 [Spathaspora passalidarum NRRL Y-27907]
MGKAPKDNRKNNNRGKPIVVADTLNSGASKIKKKIRDIERLLAKKTNNLPADKRIEYDRALKALRVELANAQTQIKAKEIAKKYHMVRFFEKKKAVRKLKQLKKTFDEVSKTEVRKDIKKARRAVRQGEIDVAYVILFPKTEKYISLYPNPKENDQVDAKDPKAILGAKRTQERRSQFRKEVEKLMDDGKLPFSIDDALAGKTIKVDAVQQATSTQEIDAPQVKPEEEEQDEFFE